MNERKKISFVIPGYRSEKTVLIVVDEIEQTMQQRDGLQYEIILVNDGSPDDVWSVIAKRAGE
ncbi:MAG: glycosyltransferase, partial [Lachnospiraceae bacterium]|nr:glycosyltransferase [Lachnospiraceae bacterium]